MNCTIQVHKVRDLYETSSLVATDIIFVHQLQFALKYHTVIFSTFVSKCYSTPTR